MDSLIVTSIFPLAISGWIVCAGLVSCVIRPLLLGKIRLSYIARILGLLYFLLFLKVSQLRPNARYIPINSCLSILNSSV